ncbi:MAG: glyceraldehyde 3-phosphate dehydrogenase NAD-binding domain-containing protein [Pedobacter sp.]|nr:glyceraldehyde 3-phosphate dehydrogenase NAD-binding domain-containing protein [Pedobacter sp.]
MSAHRPFRVGINGFGRIGRLLARHLCSGDYRGGNTRGAPAVVVSHINDPAPTAAEAAHLLAFDSVHGRWPCEAEAESESLVLLNGQKVGFSRERETAKVGWAGKADLVIDCTGRLKKEADVQAFLAGGVPRVLVSQPVEGIPNIVPGVNEHSVELSLARAICAASCTTNCLAPVTKVLHEVFTVTGGLITTVHGLTNDQALLDQAHEDWRRGRQAGSSLIPTTSGFAKAIGRVLPELAGKLEGFAIRAPITNASLIDACFLVQRSTSAGGVNAAFEAAASDALRNILAIEHRPLVSADFRGDRHSATVDASLTQVMGGNLVKVVAWYDNETAYSHRLAELTHRLAGL